MANKLNLRCADNIFATQYDARLLLLSHGIIRLQANRIAGNVILIIIKLESELVYMYISLCRMGIPCKFCDDFWRPIPK